MRTAYTFRSIVTGLTHSALMSETECQLYLRAHSTLTLV